MWYNEPTMLPAGSLEAEAVPPLPGYRPSRAPDDGRRHHQKHVELTTNKYKPTNLLLVDHHLQQQQKQQEQQQQKQQQIYGAILMM